MQPIWKKVYVPTVLAIVFLVVLLVISIQHPFAWLAIITGLIVYAFGDALTDGVKWVARFGPLARAGLILEYLIIILLVVVGIAFNDDIQKQVTQVVVNTILDKNFGGSTAVAALSAIIPILFILYVMFRSKDFNQLRAG